MESSQRVLVAAHGFSWLNMLIVGPFYVPHHRVYLACFALSGFVGLLSLLRVAYLIFSAVLMRQLRALAV